MLALLSDLYSELEAISVSTSELSSSYTIYQLLKLLTTVLGKM